MVPDKIKTREALRSLLQLKRDEGKTIGFTSGVFDLIHAGHVDYLQQAKAQCDCLVVGVNDDESVRRYKGSNRPLVPAEQRMRVLAAMMDVDYVFQFSERRNQTNIEYLKPHIYFKAGDYNKEQLTSASVIEAIGGKVILIPVIYPVSTSELLQRLNSHPSDQPHTGWQMDTATTHAHWQLPALKAAPAIFLDRDGTINEEISYLHEPEKFKLINGVGEGLAELQNMGYRLVVITNQAGIGLGYFTVEDFYRVNQAMFKALKPFGVKIDRIYFCPHGITENCPCRKPNIMLLERAVKDLNIDLAHSFYIGDQSVDMATADRIGIKKFLVNTGCKGLDGHYSNRGDWVVDSILDAAKIILSLERSV